MVGPVDCSRDHRWLSVEIPERKDRPVCSLLMKDPSTPFVVLVVDDEPLIRMYATDVLEDAGFRVVEADNADVALTMLDRHPEIGVLFTDIHMPGQFDGLTLARKVYERRPDIQLIIVSGKGRPTKAEIPGEGTFFAKPYDGTDIAKLIEAGSRMSQRAGDTE